MRTGSVRCHINSIHFMNLNRILESDSSRGALRALTCVLNQAPPIYPPRNDKVLNKGAETLRTVLKNDSSTWNHIHHLRCKEGTIESIAEQCRNFLDGEKAIYRFLHYFRFNSHDVRSNSLRPLFTSILAHTGYNRISTFSWQTNIGLIGTG